MVSSAGASVIPLTTLLFIYYFMGISGFYLNVCLHTTYKPGAPGGQKKASDPLGLELQMVAICHMITGN